MALWVGQAVSHFGTYVAWVTLPFLVLDIQKQTGEGSTLDFAITYALETAPTLLLGLFVGVLIDRWHLRPVMISTDLLRASAFFYLAASYGSYGVGTVFVVAFLVGSFTTFFDGALFALIPSLVPRRRLADANSFVAASQQFNFAIGALAGGLIAYSSGGPALGLYINGLSFVVSAVFLGWVGRVEHHRSAADARAPFMTEAMDGLRYIWTETRLRITTIAAAVPNFVMGFIEATVVLLFSVMLGATNTAEIGVLVAAMGVGGIVGALVAPRVIKATGLGRTMTFGMILTGVLLFAVMFTTYGVVPLALNVGWMIGVSLINVSLATIRQHYADDNMLGRVITVSRAIGWATLPLGALIGGWLGESEETLPVVARIFPILLVRDRHMVIRDSGLERHLWPQLRGAAQPAGGIPGGGGMSNETATHLTPAELELGLPRIGASPDDEGLVEMLVIRPVVDQRETPDSVEVSADLGVHGDRWSMGKSREYPETQITIINSRLLDLVSGGRERWALAGDNVVADLDLSHANLPAGQKLEAGSAILEVTEQPHTGCNKFASRFGADALRFVNVGPGKDLRLRGLYVQVVQHGVISVGDRIRKV